METDGHKVNDAFPVPIVHLAMFSPAGPRYGISSTCDKSLLARGGLGVNPAGTGPERCAVTIVTSPLVSATGALEDTLELEGWEKAGGVSEFH